MNGRRWRGTGIASGPTLGMPATLTMSGRGPSSGNDEVAEPVAGPWPLLEVDTTSPVDVAAVVRFVQTSPQRSKRRPASV